MKKRNIYQWTVAFIAIVLLGQGCEEKPAYFFNDTVGVYFKYPYYVNPNGVVTSLEMDSVVYSFAGRPEEVVQDTVWLAVQIIGERQNRDRPYHVQVVRDSSTAVEGIDFEKLKPEYIVEKNSGIDSFPIVLYRNEIKKRLNKTLMVKLSSTTDLPLACVEYQQMKVNVSAYYNEPWWWEKGISMYLKEFHFLKLEQWVKETGSLDVDPYGDIMYNEYVSKKIQKYFEENVILDPFTGKRVLC